MIGSGCTHDRTQSARINGRVLAKFIEMTRKPKPLRAINVTEWFDLCLECDLDVLTAETDLAVPFQCPDGAMRTLHDLDAAAGVLDSRCEQLLGFCFTRSALQGSLSMMPFFDSTTSDVESLGREIVAAEWAEVLDFSERVCDWGDGQRVWGNLVRLHGSNLAKQLQAVLAAALAATSDESAIECAASIRGLGVSFASKHLRMLAPQRFAVLDDVLSQGLGLALNPKGYALFMQELRGLRDRLGFEQSLAELEGGIFFLVRQVVRSKEVQSRSRA